MPENIVYKIKDELIKYIGYDNLKEIGENAIKLNKFILEIRRLMTKEDKDMLSSLTSDLSLKDFNKNFNETSNKYLSKMK